MPDPAKVSPRFSFSAHVALLEQFLARRSEIVERIEEKLLNVRGKETERNRNRAHFDRLLNDCFFTWSDIDPELARLKGQLAAMHLADGFEPILLDKFSIEFDPLDLVIRAYEYWGAHRWPGRSGRLMWAGVVYAAFFIRQLENLSLRMWDDGNEVAGDRLEQLQTLLDRLNGPDAQAANRPVFVRDVCWLAQTAQGALTKDLQPYFRIAEHIGASFTDSQRLGFHIAGAKLAGGHLRSQIRYRAAETGRSIDDPENLAIARNSNSMDTALLLRDLVALLKEYENMCSAPDEASNAEIRFELADAILQGMSSDIQLFVTRLDALTPATMIEHLFLERGEDDRVRFSVLGRSHMDYLRQYRDLVGRLADRLQEDALALAPQADAYSPYGISYGFAADLLSNLALDKLISPASSWANLSFEDTFASRGDLELKLDRAKTLAALPKRPGEQDHFYHSSEFAAQIFGRLVAALDARSNRESEANVSEHRDARIYVSAESEQSARSAAGLSADVVSASEYCFYSGRSRIQREGWGTLPVKQILTDRNEGRYLASAECDGEWCAISKFILTLFICQGKDVLLSGVPSRLIESLLVTCPGLAVPVAAA